MTRDEQPPPAEGDALVGARPRSELKKVCAELEALPPGETRQARLAQGFLAACRWALGVETTGPVTGGPLETDFAMPYLTAESDAAAVRLESLSPGSAAHDYVEGVHVALTWLCGQSEERP
ncbi:MULTISPECIES: hypothetical protein [Streptomyces]|uniref:Uncharacterized protein n=1 Tax=Streptomyces noursei TaxID=1971 RepID=A0A401QSY5_STRNR|nr:hypothetical protein [Streptomyces noursei]AKA01412.1 hypothetical protein SAZ_01975 [Streptomyces noursei ZPM]EOT03089.1 hypothetical protein K530_15406 [Streptomyces noursei CCRC 11814]EXU92242.1 hypothetical protein P354_25620 [Streptomyces noursei PD-1]MCE4941547.1 hypothetical protein [Streptomyces noursei]MCZ0974739.1 hypothetical protein [Streptomyces noursei]